ncbi:chromatin modification-related protein eaf-1-like [Portunus trituberculatus]|uniref:chromatin modification-related protein eaf-1-like n=1 Tax=Portunus trituberculatus TaxID=210409 RepID=UPI001E1D04E1|nr:chromatin modification-related protein eaf-1-like [Portunus trituberculatus]
MTSSFSRRKLRLEVNGAKYGRCGRHPLTFEDCTNKLAERQEKQGRRSLQRCQPLTHPVSQPPTHPVSQPASHPPSQPATHQPSQPASQSLRKVKSRVPECC